MWVFQRFVPCLNRIGGRRNECPKAFRKRFSRAQATTTRCARTCLAKRLPMPSLTSAPGQWKVGKTEVPIAKKKRSGDTGLRERTLKSCNTRSQSAHKSCFFEREILDLLHGDGPRALSSFYFLVPVTCKADRLFKTDSVSPTKQLVYSRYIQHQ